MCLQDARQSIFEARETSAASSSTDPNSKSQDDLKDSKKSSSGGSKLAERAKKKAWYNVIYPSYKSRSEDFKKLFHVPDDERLVVGELQVILTCAVVCVKARVIRVDFAPAN